DREAVRVPRERVLDAPLERRLAFGSDRAADAEGRTDDRAGRGDIAGVAGEPAAEPAQAPVLDQDRRDSEVALEEADEAVDRAAEAEEAVRLLDQPPPRRRRPALVEHEPEERGEPVEQLLRRAARVDERAPFDT